MNTIEREYLIHRIISGKTRCRVHDTNYYVMVPTEEILFNAHVLYEDVLAHYRFSNWLTDSQAKTLLIRNGLISEDIDHNLTAIDNRLDNLKLELYNNAHNGKYQKIMDEILAVENKQSDLYMLRHMLDHVTIAGFAQQRMNDFISLHTQMDTNMAPLWLNNRNFNISLFTKIQSEHYKQIISVAQYREIARTEPWRSYYNANKHTIVSHSDQMRTLLIYTRMYENAYESIDCPSDDIINNDYLFDGWMIYMRKKNEEERKKNKEKRPLTTKRQAKPADKSEVFIVAKSQEEANEIYANSSMEAQMIRRQRAAILEKHGVIDDVALPDSQQIIHRKLQEQLAQAKKNRR